jgi:hypothetical protein
MKRERSKRIRFQSILALHTTKIFRRKVQKLKWKANTIPVILVVRTANDLKIEATKKHAAIPFCSPVSR